MENLQMVLGPELWERLNEPSNLPAIVDFLQSLPKTKFDQLILSCHQDGVNPLITESNFPLIEGEFTNRDDEILEICLKTSCTGAEAEKALLKKGFRSVDIRMAMSYVASHLDAQRKYDVVALGSKIDRITDIYVPSFVLNNSKKCIFGLKSYNDGFNRSTRFLVVHDNRRIIDCDAEPTVPEMAKEILEMGFFVKSHQKNGQLVWDPRKISLVESKTQKEDSKRNERLLSFWFSPEEFRGQVLNANVLDYLLANPELIPESWKKEGAIYFWGTIFAVGKKDEFNLDMVRILEYSKGEKKWVSTVERGTSIYYFAKAAVLIN